MLLVGLTGGIGSGKSTVAAMLAARGAVLIDADAITRWLQQPGQPVFEAMVARFGAGVVSSDGILDRAAVADIVFIDEAARKDLEAIVHPAVAVEVERRLKEYAGTEAIVVYDVPLLVEGGASSYGAVIVVDADQEVAVRRLVDLRGFDERDVRARVASQVSRAERLAVADRVIDNVGTVQDLRSEVDGVWAWLQERERASGVETADPPR